MAWEDDVDPDWLHELPFWLVAAMAHGALLTLNPVIRWGKAARADEKMVPVEFVARLPDVAPNLAPAAGDGTTAMPRHGPGAYEPPKVKAGAGDPPLKPIPVAKPAAVKGPVVKQGSTVKPKPIKAVAPPVDPAAQRRAESARIQAAAAARAKQERAAEARAAAETARAEAAERASAQRQERARLAAAQAEAARLERERRAEAARLEAERQAAIAAERRRVLAERKAAKAARRAELSSALATMADPDEALDAGAAPPAGGRGGARPLKGPAPSGASRAGAAAALSGLDGGGAGAAGEPGAGLRGAARAAAAAALAESPDPGDAAGSGGADLIDAPAKGGGAGPEGGGVSWSVDGAVGNRRVLERVLPVSPDWVGTRGLDLTVTVRFQVLPDGRVRPGAVQKTSGFPDIDKRALDALKRWRFEAAPSAKGEVWGRVTFRFTS